MPYELHNNPNRVPIKSWIPDHEIDPSAKHQLFNTSAVPIVGPWLAVMPDVHAGIGSTVGSVIPTNHAIIPASLGVDIGCGMLAARLNVRAEQLPDSLTEVRRAIEQYVPVGFADFSRTAFANKRNMIIWSELKNLGASFDAKVASHAPQEFKDSKYEQQIGTLGGGNHFIELCLDERDELWLMLHSGSRNIGNRIGRYYITKARECMERNNLSLPDKDLAWLDESDPIFHAYMDSVEWAQYYAALNRNMMMLQVLDALRAVRGFPTTQITEKAVTCHHNYVAKETHYGQSLYITRKGAISAKAGELGIIPGSMGARSYIVRGKGNPTSFTSCSHGAGRRMSRSEAKRQYSVADVLAATEGVECRKDAGVIDEIPMAYKDIDEVIAAQTDLVEVVHTLKQIVCIKG